MVNKANKSFGVLVKMHKNGFETKRLFFGDFEEKEMVEKLMKNVCLRGQ